MRVLFSFPDPVNEVSARLVAAGVVVHVRADPGPQPRMGRRGHRLRLRGPGAHGADAQPTRPTGDAVRHAEAPGCRNGRYRAHPSASPRGWASPSR